MPRRTVNIRMTEAEQAALYDAAVRLGIKQPTRAGYFRDAPNLSGVVQKIAQGLIDPSAPGVLGIYDPATEVVMSRAEYDLLVTQAQEAA